MAKLDIQVRRKELERERAYLFPHIPLVEGILEKALEPGAVVKVSAGVLSNWPSPLLRSRSGVESEPNCGFGTAAQLRIRLHQE